MTRHRLAGQKQQTHRYRPHRCGNRNYFCVRYRQQDVYTWYNPVALRWILEAGQSSKYALWRTHQKYKHGFSCLKITGKPFLSTTLYMESMTKPVHEDGMINFVKRSRSV